MLRDTLVRVPHGMNARRGSRKMQQASYTLNPKPLEPKPLNPKPQTSKPLNPKSLSGELIAAYRAHKVEVSGVWGLFGVQGLAFRV